jgi:guanylate kinase
MTQERKPQYGKLIIFSAPSGAGKTTLVKNLLGSVPMLEFSISAASRAKRPTEIDGKDYYFITVDEFRKKIANDEFLEWEEVYKDHFYGTLKSEVERIWSKGYHVIFDVDVMGGLSIKKFYGDKALAIFVMPPSVEELENRLRKRSTETEENLKKRMDKARQELTYASGFDRIIVNEDIEQAIKEAQTLVRKFLISE